MLGQLSSNPWWVFLLLGVVAGVVSGTLGLGSGVVIVPALVVLCGFGQKSAQGTALAVMVPMALVGAVRYWRNPDIPIDAAVVGLIICGAIVGTLVGTEVAMRMPSGALRKLFAIVLIAVAIRMLTIKSAPGRQRPASGSAEHVKAIEPGGLENGTG